MYLFVNYPFSRYQAGQDPEIRAELLDALRPFGIEQEDGTGTDFETRDISFTLSDTVDHEGVLLAAHSVILGYDGKAELSAGT